MKHILLSVHTRISIRAYEDHSLFKFFSSLAHPFLRCHHYVATHVLEDARLIAQIFTGKLSIAVIIFVFAYQRRLVSAKSLEAMTYSSWFTSPHLGVRANRTCT